MARRRKKKLSKKARATRTRSRKQFAGSKGAKACKIVRENRAGGRSLTGPQKRMFGARCGEFKKRTGKR